MPRNAQGLYTLPAGNPVVPNTLIETSWANPTMADIADALTASLPRDGSAPMTGPLTLQAAAPTQPRHAVSKGYMEQFLAYATGMPIGAIIPIAGSTVPAGYLLCDGQAVSRTTYADLFTAIGTIYGSGDGATTFNVPDLRDWFIRGRADARAIGSQQSAALASHTHSFSDPGHTHTASQPAHDHTITTGGHNHTLTDPGHTHSPMNSRQAGDGGSFGAYASSGANIGTALPSSGTGISIAAVGNLGGSADSRQPVVTVASAVTGASIGATGDAETRPQNVAMNYVIKAVNDAAATVSITGITSSDDNMIAIDNTNPVVPMLDIKSNIAFGIPKLDINGKILLSQLPVGATVLLGFYDASTGQNPSQAHPTTNYTNGEMYILSVGGSIQVRNPATGVESMTAVLAGGTLLYLEGQSQPDGWYYSVPVTADNAVNIGFQPAGTISATNVQAAIEELDSETQSSLATKAPLSAGTAAGTSFTPTGSIAATTVQDAIVEVAAETASLSNAVPVMDGAANAGVGTAASRDDHVHPTDTSRAPTSAMTAVGTSVTPTGGITATNVQAALAELDTEKSNKDVPAFSAKAASNQSVTSGSLTRVTLGTEVLDTHGWFSGNRFTPQMAGWYQINGTVRANGATLTNGSAQIYKNASPYINLGAATATFNGALTLSGSALVYLNGTTDFVELWGVSTGTTTIFEVSGVFASEMSGFFVRP